MSFGVRPVIAASVRETQYAFLCAPLMSLNVSGIGPSRAPGAPEIFRGLSGSFECCRSLLRGHGDGGFEVGQAPSRSGRQDRSEERLIQSPDHLVCRLL